MINSAKIIKIKCRHVRKTSDNFNNNKSSNNYQIKLSGNQDHHHQVPKRKSVRFADDSPDFLIPIPLVKYQHRKVTIYVKGGNGADRFGKDTQIYVPRLDKRNIYEYPRPTKRAIKTLRRIKIIREDLPVPKRLPVRKRSKFHFSCFPRNL